MYRVKISSKAIRKNQVKFAKMAQKAINISDAFDSQKLYKDSSTFYKIAEAYSRFILAEDVEKKEEENPVEDIPLEDIYASNLHPELVSLYSEHNFGKEPFGSRIFSKVGIPNSSLVNDFYNSLVRNNGSYIALVKEMKDYKIKPDTGFFMEDQTKTALKFALAKYFKNNNYFTSDHAQKIYNRYFYMDDIKSKIQLQSDSENQQRIYSDLQILREFFADTMQANRKITESAISFILQNNYPFKAEDVLDESKKEIVQKLKDNLILVLSFAFDNFSNPKLMNLNFELLQRLKFIEKNGVDNFIAILQKAGEKKSPISFSDSTLPYWWHKFIKIKTTNESRASNQQQQRVLDFLLKNDSKLSEIPFLKQHGGGALISAANYLSIYNILEKFGEEDTIKILARYSQNFNSFNDYIKIIELGMLFGINVDEVIKIMENYGSNTAITQLIFEAIGQKTSKYLDLNFLDFLHQIYENNIDDFNLLIQSIKTNEVPVEKIELVKGSLIKVLKFKPGYLKEILDYYKTWKSESDSLLFILTFIQAKYYLGDEILKYSPEILTNASMFGGRNIKTVAENLTKYGTVDSPEPNFDPEKYEEIKQKVTADPTLKDFDERKIMLFFDGDMDYAHLASKLNLPTVNTEDATKIGMAYKNLDVKGVYNLRGLIQNYKFFPESMIQKYDTNELGVLSSIFTEEKLLLPGYGNYDEPLFDENYLNELDQKMQTAISFIDKKYPNLSKTKSVVYYIILRYVLNNPTSMLSDPNQLAEMLKIHSKSIINGQTEKANTFPDADIMEAFLFNQQSDYYGLKLQFDQEIQQFFNNEDGTWRSKIKSYSSAEVIEKFSSGSNSVVWRPESFKINTELEDIQESKEDFYEFIETYKDYLIEPITSFIWNLDELESKFRPEVKEIESFATDMNEIYPEAVEIIIHNQEGQLALAMLSELDPEKADILRKLYIQYRFKIVDLESIKNYLENPESEIPPIVKYRYDVNFDEIKDYHRKTFSEPIDAFSTQFAFTDINESLTNIQKIINLFGNETFKWLNKFTASKYFNPLRTKDDPENISKFEALSDDEKSKLIHDASQIIPSLKRYKNKGAKEFLLQKYTKNNDENIKTIMVNWDAEVDFIDETQNHISYVVAQVANFKDIDVLANEIRTNTLLKIFGDNPPKEIAFAKEVAKWYRPAENDDDDDDDEGVENELGQDIMIFDIDKYKRLEEFYIESKQTPLPKWAQTAPMTQSNLKARFLPREDPRGIFLGQYTACCQHPDNAAYSSAIDGTMSPNACFFVVENHLGRIVGQAYVWQDLNGNVCFDSFETGGAGSSIFHSTERQKAVKSLIQNFAAKMGNVKVTLGSSRINITDKVTKRLENPALGLAKLYNTYGALPSIYVGDSINQYLISDNRSKEEADRQESKIELRAGSPEMYKHLIGNPNPKLMSQQTWYDDDFSNASTLSNAYQGLPQIDDDGDIVLGDDWEDDED